MGAIITRLRGTSAFVAEGDDKTEGGGDKTHRRKNSLAYNVSRCVNYEGSDFTSLIDEIKYERNEKVNARVRASRFTKMAEDLLSGNMRELKSQIAVDFQHINRQYKDFGDSSAVHFICQEGYFEMLEYMTDPHHRSEFEEVELDLDIKNAKGRTPLLLCFTPPTATFQGMKFGVDPEGVPLAVKPDDIDVAGDWLRPGGPRSREKCVRLLINHEVDVNHKDFHDFTALHYACMWGWASTVKLLLQAGADANAKTTAGRTPLMYAIEGLHSRLAETLAYDKRVHINAADVEGVTGLMVCVEAGEAGYELLERLLVAGADPELETVKRKTALSIACKMQLSGAVHILLNHNCRRRPEAFTLLQGAALKEIETRLRKEEAEAKANDEKDRKRAEEEAANPNYGGGGGGNKSGYRGRSPYGQWVEYIDKRGRGPFYYNPVTRKSQWIKPGDFKINKSKEPKLATFGMNFYH